MTAHPVMNELNTPRRSLRQKLRQLRVRHLIPWTPVLAMLAAGNPLFALEARHLKRGGDFLSLERWTLVIALRTILWLLLPGLATAALLIREFVYWYNNGSYSWNAYPFYMLVTNIVGVWVVGLFGLSILGSFLQDFSNLSAGLNAITREKIAGRWDLLRLTLLSEADITHAKHTLTRLRAWRMLIRIMTMRVLVILLGIGLALVPNPYNGGELVYQRLLWEFPRNPVIYSLVTVGVVIFLVVFLAEPFWRQQAMTALSLAMGSGRNAVNALLAGLGSIAAVWMSQAVIVYLLVRMIELLNRWMFDWFYGGMPGNRGLAPYDYVLVGYLQVLLVLFACALTAVVIFTYYRLLTRWMTRRVQRRAFVY